MNWRKVFAKSEKFKDKFKPFKTENKKELINRTEFTGNKTPKSGDPAKVELNHWHAGNSLGKKDRQKEHKSSGSAVMNPKVKREDFVSQKTSNWRNVLIKRAEVSFKQKSDGEINIDVTSPPSPTLQTTPSLLSEEESESLGEENIGKEAKSPPGRKKQVEKLKEGGFSDEEAFSISWNSYKKKKKKARRLGWKITKTHEELMEEAYDLWKKPENKSWSSEEFLQNLPSQAHRAAVVLGNLNYQVENGGFDQWYSNRYGKRDSDFLVNDLLLEIGTDTSLKVAKIIEKAQEIIEELEDPYREDRGIDDNRLFSELDELNSSYYKINEQFLNDCEAYLQGLPLTSSKHNWRQILGASEPDIQFKRTPDGKYELNVTHPKPEPPELPVLDTTLQTPQLQETGPQVQASQQEPDSSKKEWIIKEATKNGKTYQLIGKECGKCVGISIERKVKGLLPKVVAKKTNSNIIDFERVEKNGLTWRELINESVWHSKFEKFVNEK